LQNPGDVLRSQPKPLAHVLVGQHCWFEPPHGEHMLLLHVTDGFVVVIF
jgi:hypothetical protein